MRKFIPYLLILLGLLVAFVATLFGSANGLPYQDPSQEMLVKQIAEARKFNLIALIGLLACVSGIFWICQRIWMKRRRKKLQTE